jgi:hypothetical protein
LKLIVGLPSTEHLHLRLVAADVAALNDPAKITMKKIAARNLIMATAIFYI